MTRVQVHFRLPKKLEDATLARLSEASAVYGIQRLRVGAELDSLMVEYDATRLKPADLEAALAAAGIAAEPV
jgi:allophanate hydrolase subunit 1